MKPSAAVVVDSSAEAGIGAVWVGVQVLLMTSPQLAPGSTRKSWEML